MNVKRLRYIKKKRSAADIQTMNSPLNLSQRSGPGCTFIILNNEQFFTVPSSSLCVSWSDLHPSNSRLFLCRSLSQNRSGLLGKQKAEAFLHSHPVSGELVVRGEPGRVGRAGWLPLGTDLLLVTKKNSSVDFSAGKH